jgi:preprotein translocase subunit SecE
MSKLTQNVLVKYLRESKEELQKVTWPTQKETIRYSIIVIVISAICAAYFGAADWLFSKGLEALLTLVS